MKNITGTKILGCLFIFFLVYSLCSIWENTSETNDSIKVNAEMKQEIVTTQTENNAQAIKIDKLSLRVENSQKIVKFVCDNYGWPCGAWSKDDEAYICYTVAEDESCESGIWVTSTFVFDHVDEDNKRFTSTR